MTLTEALKSARNIKPEAPPYTVLLACGFAPLHLETFLTAYLQQRLPARRIQTRTGLYGDVAGTLESPQNRRTDAIALALEWADLDPRLGFRGSGAWGPSSVPDIVSESRKMLDRIAAAIERHPREIRITVSLPTLPLPPVFYQAGWQASEAELLLERHLTEFAAAIAPRAAIVNRQRLLDESPTASRFDLKSELLFGLPYSLAHADALGRMLARLLAPPAPKKGVITDLDNTLWSGIVGEAGPENVSWDLASHHQLHGLYQKLLSGLSEQGVLVGVASRNNPETVRKVFDRPDILLKPERVFPLEVHWNAKSGSVGRILDVWNIAADSVIFVDDSPMELAEVAAAHPGIECIQFPANDYAAGHRMLWSLRDLCGKESISRDDSIRLESIRKSVRFRDDLESSATPESFLRDIGAVITLDFNADSGNSRLLELVNKTNQFNLNGTRYTESDWRRQLSCPGAFVVAVNYEDKFGPLGTIAVVSGVRENGRLAIDTWVMSCRAFARRIEHQCLKALFDQYSVREIYVNFAPTPKNGPAHDFLSAIAGTPLDAPLSIPRTQFDATAPPLYHQVKVFRGSDADETRSAVAVEG